MTLTCARCGRQFYKRPSRMPRIPACSRACLYPSPEERFWSRVKQSYGCWEWTGTRTRLGYGSFSMIVNGRTTHLAHIASWHIAGGNALPPIGMKICHHCDNRECVNPAHLFMGTQRDNMLDCIKKGRMTPIPHPGFGEDHPISKLTWNQVREIRGLFSSGERQTSLAQRFRVTRATIRSITRNVTWQELRTE